MFGVATFGTAPLPAVLVPQLAQPSAALCNAPVDWAHSDADSVWASSLVVVVHVNAD